jgi:hypothetical protein
MAKDALPREVGQFIEFARLRLYRRKSSPQEKNVLVHVNQIESHHVGIAIAAPAYLEWGGGRLVGYYTDFHHQNFVGRLRDWLESRLSLSAPTQVRLIFRAIGVRTFVRPNRRPARKAKTSVILSGLLKTVKTKRDLENFAIDGVLIGDLIYDQYLVENKAVTVDLQGESLRHIALRAIELFCFWQHYFESKPVSAVFGSDAYLSAIPNRLALARGIDVFQVGSTIERVPQPGTGNYFSQFPAEFSKISRPGLLEELGHARTYLSDFVAGKPVEALFGHTFRAFSSAKASEHLPPSNGKTTVLVAPHNPFSDSPHAIGRSLFPDYAEWLEFLGALSNELDYTWFLKVHPDRRDEDTVRLNREWIETYCSRYPRFTLLDEGVSHGQLIRAGIDAVLTVSGSIGFEYAACGIRVIHASPDNPHAGYGFNLSPSSVESYEQAIRGLHSITWPIDPEEVAQYFFMYMFESRKSPVLGNAKDFLKRTGGSAYSLPEYSLYQIVQEEFDSNWSVSARASLGKFFQSGDLHWYERHCASEGP